MKREEIENGSDGKESRYIGEILLLVKLHFSFSITTRRIREHNALSLKISSSGTY